MYREFEHEAEIKKCLLLGHAAGISPASTSLESLFEKWISQLQKFLSVVPYKIQEEGDQTTIKERKNTFWEKQKLFSELLIQASHKTRVICLFDAINQMERTEIMKNMSWLPKILSSNSVLILTAIPGVETNSISKMANGRIQTLDKLNENDSREILIALYKKNHKTPNEDVMNIVLQREKGGIKSSSNPLWLNLAMEHLLVLDEDDFSDHNNLNGNTPEEKLHSLLMKTAMEFPSDLETLYFSLLERAKKNFGNRINAKWIQKMLNYIACSRFGLRRDDLRKLLNKNNEEDFEIKFVSTLNYFGAHIVERGPLRLLNFSHQQLKFWIDEDNNIEFDSSVYKKLHKDIAQHFKKLDRSDLLRQQEIVYHFLLAEEDKEISSYYGDSELTEFEIESASKILANSMTDLEDFWVSDAFIFLSNLFEKNDKFSIKEGERNLYICSRYIYNLDPILENIASIDCRIENFEALVNELNNLWKNNYTTISVLDYMNIGYLKLTDLYNRTGEPEQAESCAIEAKKISEILIREDPNDSYFFRNKYIIQLQTGDALFNSEKFSEALENYLTSLEQNKNLSKKYPDEVEFLLDFSVISDKIAHCYKIIGDNKKSNEYYNNILTVNEELYNKYPESLSITNALCMSYDRIGEINMSNGNYNNALNIYLKSVNIQNEIFKSNPTDIFLIGNIVINLNKIGMINRIQKNYDISFRHHERALNLIKTINPKDIFNPEQMLNFLMCYVFLSELYLDKKEYDKSLENISTAKALCIEYIDNFLESYNINAVLSKCMIIDAENNTAIGNYDKAVENYNASVKIDEKLIASTPENYGASKNLISKYKTFGDLLLGINRIDDALNIFERAQIIHLNLNKKFPENFYYYKTLTENCFKIGYCLYIKKEYEKANDWLGSFLGNFQNILDSGLAYDNSLLHSAQWAKQIVDNINYSISFEEKQKENNIKTNRDTALSVELSELEKLILDAEEYFFNSKWEIAEKLFLKLLSKNIVVDNIQYKLSICIINGNEKLSSENFNRVLNLISQLRVNGKLMEAAEIEKLLLKKK